MLRGNSRTNIRNSNIRTRNHDNNRETNTRETNNNSNVQDNKHKSDTDNQIQELQNEIIALKAAKQTTEHPQNGKPVPPRGRDSPQEQSTYQNRETPDVEQVMTFINNTMATLAEFKKQFEKQQPTERTLQGTLST